MGRERLVPAATTRALPISNDSILVVRTHKSDPNQSDVYYIDSLWRTRKVKPAPLPTFLRLKWSHRDRRFYIANDELQDREVLKSECDKWRYWIGDWLKVAMTTGMELEDLRIVLELEKMQLSRVDAVLAAFKRLVRSGRAAEYDYAIYCDKCKDWLPTSYRRHICPHRLICADRQAGYRCAMPQSVKIACRQYSTCFIDLEDKDIERLKCELNAARKRKHGWARKFANQCINLERPLFVCSGLITRDGEAPNYSSP